MLPKNLSYADRLKMARDLGFEAIQAYTTPDQHEAEILPGPVRAQVFDVRGRCVRTLIDGDWPAGRQIIALDGRDDRGAMLPAGVYYYRVRTAEGSQTGRFLLLR